MIRIISTVDGFWRAGIKHSTKPTDYPDGHFTAEQLELLKNEPKLIIQELPGDPGAAGKTDAAGKKPDLDGDLARIREEFAIAINGLKERVDQLESKIDMARRAWEEAISELKDQIKAILPKGKK